MRYPSQLPHLIGAAFCFLLAQAAPAQVATLVSPNPDVPVGSEFGESSGSVRDVDGDGVADIFVGAPSENIPNAGLPTGRVHIFSGATHALIHTLMLPEFQFNSGFGASVAPLADVDGDGRGDLLVTAIGQIPPPGVGSGGRVHLYSGASGEWLAQFHGDPDPATFCSFGALVIAVPDRDSGLLQDAGIVADGLDCNYFRSYSTETGQVLMHAAPYLGSIRSAAVTGDLDGDGVAEIALGMPGARDFAGDPRRGRVFIVSGATGEVLRTLAGPGESSGGFGISVARIEDLDGDGFSDLVVGANASVAPGAPSGSGLTHIFSGLTGNLIRTLRAPVPRQGAWFGLVVVPQDDLDGDGREDLLVTAYNESPPGLPGQAGAAYLFSGATGEHLRTLHSPNPQLRGWFGERAGRFSEHRDNGRATIGVAAPSEWGNRGRVYLFASCRADTNADGLINSGDISHFLTGWVRTVGSPPGALPPPGVHTGDYNGDGSINSADISAFLSAWLDAVVVGGCP